MDIILKEIKNKYTVTLHKVNREIIGEIPFFYMDSISRGLDDIDPIELTVKKYYISSVDKQKRQYFYYDEFKTERLIALDGEYFVIKEISEDSIKNTKTIKAYGYEKKLEKNNITVEGIGFMLLDSDEENLIFSLSDYMKEEIGWSIGHVDNNIRYSNYSEGETKLTPRMRWQESLDQDWYSFLANTLAEQFECITVFDRKNKTVNLYSIDSFGENLNISLSYDNYIKSLERKSDSSNIITRLKLSGNEEKCFVREYIPSGYDYIENYSYFIENEEMSEELINAMKLHEEMIKGLSIEWRGLKNQKIQLETEKTKLENDLYFNLESFKQYKSIAEGYRDNNDPTNAVIWEAKCTKLKDEEVILKANIQTKKNEIDSISKRMSEINSQCRRNTAKNTNGEFIFNDKLLEELKEFLYYDTYTNDAFYDAEELISVGERELDSKCKPTFEFSIDNKNFMRRLINNNFRQQWNGQLGLGDIISLYYREENKEEFIFLVGYTQNFKDNSLSLELSNKKTKNNTKRDISMLLKLAKNDNKQLMRNRYVLNALREYRYNL